MDLAYEQLEEKNTEILDSITYAKRIQSAILPPVKTIKTYLKDSFVIYKPKDIVAGDFYWLEYQNDHILFAVADCTGHGVPGAMVSVICNNGLNRSVREHNLTDPGLILNKTREIVIKEFEKSEEVMQDGMDIAFVSLQTDTSASFGAHHEEQTPNAVERYVLKYAGAHNPLWIIRNNSNSIEEFKADKQHIGHFRYSEPFTTHKTILNKGDLFYLFSDGYADQFGGEKGRKFKTAKFKQIIEENCHRPLSEQKEILLKAFEDWKGELEQIDDICVIGVRV